MKKLLLLMISLLFINLSLQAQWVQMSSGMITDPSITSIANSGTNIFAGTWFGGVYRSTNNGSNWYAVNSGLSNMQISCLTASNSIVFAGFSGYGVYFSVNNGANWYSANSGLSNLNVYSLASSGSNIFAGTYGSSVFRSTNNGTNWSYAGFGNFVVWALTANTVNLFAGTNAGVFLSTNNGSTWSVKNDGLTSTNVQSFTITGAYIFAGTSGGLFRSSNNGTNWVGVNSGLTNNNVRSLASVGANIFAGTQSGIFFSTNNGNNWIQKNQGFSSSPSVSVLLTDSNFVYAGIAGNYVWRRPLTDFIILASPVLISPENNSIAVPLNPYLIWSKPQYVTKFRVLLATDSLFTNIILNDSLLTDSVRNLTNLSQLTNYYWKVSAGNNAGWSSYSTTYKFKTIGIPTQVLLNLPANNSVNQPVNITFKWYKAFDQTLKTNKAVSNYWLEYSADSSFQSGVIKDSTLTDSLKSVTGINTASKYYWRVKAKNIAGWGNFSSTWNFTTVPPVPSAPVLVSPPNNATNLQPNVLLDWNTVQYAAGYRVQIANDSIFTSVIFDTNSVIQDTLRVRPGLLYANMKYYWRVNASNISGTGTWSSIWNFRINPTTLNPSENEIPDKFALHQNYPNPFNPSTKIRFQIPSWEGWQQNADGVGLVTLKVFDVMGKQVTVLVNEQLQPGTYETDWNASAFSSGVYFYKITAGNFSETKRMLLVK